MEVVFLAKHRNCSVLWIKTYDKMGTLSSFKVIKLLCYSPKIRHLLCKFGLIHEEGLVFPVLRRVHVCQWFSCVIAVILELALEGLIICALICQLIIGL